MPNIKQRISQLKHFLSTVRRPLPHNESSEKGSQQTELISEMKLYLNKLCDHALGNTTASIRSEMMPHQESHPSDPTGGDGNL